MKTEDSFIIQITSKGEIEGAKMFFPVLQWLVIFKEEHPNGTLDDAIKQVYKTLQRAIKRGKENKDSTVTMENFEAIREIEPLVEHIYKIYCHEK